MSEEIYTQHHHNFNKILLKVSSVTFRSGKTSEDLSVIKQCDVESRFAGWISCFIDEPSHTVVKIEAKGPDNSLR
jgi:hypothetical protein